MARVLVVEDNAANMSLAVFLLQSAGHTAITATDAELGLTLARDEQPQLILMDDKDTELRILKPSRRMVAGAKRIPSGCEWSRRNGQRRTGQGDARRRSVPGNGRLAGWQWYGDH